MFDEKTYQMIYDEVSQYLLPDWEKVVIYLEYGEGSYTFSFYQKNKDGYINGYDLPETSEERINASFEKIDKWILKERKKEKGELWTNMTMTINSAGEIHVDYDYTDLSEEAYKHLKMWKHKYLK